MSSTIGHINLQKKLTGKCNAGNLHVAFDEVGTGNGPKARTAPVLDHTIGDKEEVKKTNEGTEKSSDLLI